MIEELEGHRALVEYRYGIRDALAALTCTIVYMLIVFGSVASTLNY